MIQSNFVKWAQAAILSVVFRLQIWHIVMQI